MTDSDNYSVTTEYDAFDRPTLTTFPDGTGLLRVVGVVAFVVGATACAGSTERVNRVEAFKVGGLERELRTTVGEPNRERAVDGKNASDLCAKDPTNVRVLEYHAPGGPSLGAIRKTLGLSPGLIAYVCVDGTGRVSKIYSADIN